MADIAIDIRNLHKVYRLYDKPLYRLLDMFGLLFRKGMYTEHPALADVNLKVERGEKVAIIGRNGAGKSTLLKIISKVLAASEGDVTINGTVHALLSIGTGFHGDFTGRENIYAYLTNLGISGAEAERKATEIIDFAEIDEFIDQPVSTYSTGMGVRLMFAASTAITPDILIVDEVLGVGDAYFVQKSINHMRHLCADEGATLLLVSHDIYTAAQICDRVIWIDRGRLFQDGPATEVLRAYEASIRLQEEARIRKRALKRRKQRERSGEPMFFQIVPKDRVTQHPGLTVNTIRLLQDGSVIDQVDMESGHADSGMLIMEEGEGNWGPPHDSNGRIVRDFLPYGSIHQRAPFMLGIPEGDGAITLEVDCLAQGDCLYFLEGYGLEGDVLCGALSPEGVTSVSIPSKVDGDSKGVEPGRVFGLESQQDIVRCGERLGSKVLTVQDVQMLGGDGQERNAFFPNDPAIIRFTVRVNDPDFSGCPEILVAVLKNGVSPQTRWIFDDVRIQRGDKDVFCELKLASLPFTPGNYSVSVGLMKAGYYEKRASAHCAASNDVIDFYKSALDFAVMSQKKLYDNIAFIVDADFTARR